MNNQRIRVPFIMLLLLSAVCIGLLITNVCQYLTNSSAQRALQEKQKSLADLKTETAKTVSWRKDYETLSGKLGTRLPSCTWSEQMPSMVTELTSIVEEHGAVIETMQPQPMTQDGKILSFPLQLGLHADLATITGILKDISNTVPLLQVERLSIGKDETKGGKLHISLTVTSFVVLDKNASLTKRHALSDMQEAVMKSAKDASATPTAKTKAKTEPHSWALSKTVSKIPSSTEDHHERN